MRRVVVVVFVAVIALALTPGPALPETTTGERPALPMLHTLRAQPVPESPELGDYAGGGALVLSGRGPVGGLVAMTATTESFLYDNGDFAMFARGPSGGRECLDLAAVSVEVASEMPCLLRAGRVDAEWLAVQLGRLDAANSTAPTCMDCARYLYTMPGGETFSGSWFPGFLGGSKGDIATAIFLAIEWA